MRQTAIRTAAILLPLLVTGCGGNYTFGPTLAAPGGVAVSLAPLNPSVAAGGSLQFTASVSGNPNTAVTWTVTPAESNGPTISATGLLTAGPTPGRFTITAISTANDSIFASTTVTITAPTSVQR